MNTPLALVDAARSLASSGETAGSFFASPDTLKTFVDGLIAFSDGSGLTGRQASLVVHAWNTLMKRREGVTAIRRLGNLDFLAEVIARFERHAARTAPSRNSGFQAPFRAEDPMPAAALPPSPIEGAEAREEPEPEPVEMSEPEPVEAFDVDTLLRELAEVFAKEPNLLGYLCVSNENEPETEGRCVLLGTQGEGKGLFWRKDLSLSSKRWSNQSETFELCASRRCPKALRISLFLFADKRCWKDSFDAIGRLLCQRTPKTAFSETSFGEKMTSGDLRPSQGLKSG